MECPLWRLLISSWSVNKHGYHQNLVGIIFGMYEDCSFRSVSKHCHHMQFLFLIGRFVKSFSFETAQFDIFHTKMLQNTSRCHVTASIWILCNILENFPHALDVHAQRVMKYIFILIYDFTITETGRLMCFCSKRADDVEKDC